MFIPEPFNKLRRVPQVILPKDAALICAYTGITTGSKVVDSGTGSGWLAIFIARIVMPTGKVISYEKKKEFADIANQNVKKLGLDKWIDIRIKDITRGIDERNIDVITLDLPEPWKVLKHAKKALKTNGYIATFLPTVNQVERLVLKAEKLGFNHLITFGNELRELLVRKDATRPVTKGLTHTAYITILRKPVR